MTETQQQTQSSSREEIAASIAIILAGTPTPNALALALIPLLPLSILRMPDLSASLSLSVAEFLLRNQPDKQQGLEANFEDLLYRAMYGVNALTRLVEAAGEEEGREERIQKAIQAEEAYFKGHIEAEARRVASRGIRDTMVSLYGKILSWHHGPRTPTDRHNHVGADGMNFDATTMPKKTQALPGVLNGCKCFYGPPVEGARMLR